MTAKALMIQGTGSDVGKSVIVAGLCRIARRRGLRIAPFKPQNMSNNSSACDGGGEIGRAQALQAWAAGVGVDHNPVLLKPETDKTSQVVVHGRVCSTMDAAQFIDSRDTLLPPVMESFERLVNKNDLIVVEGAGSPAEINLRQRDIANMGFARRAGVPVCLHDHRVCHQQVSWRPVAVHRWRKRHRETYGLALLRCYSLVGSHGETTCGRCGLDCPG